MQLLSLMWGNMGNILLFVTIKLHEIWSSIEMNYWLCVSKSKNLLPCTVLRRCFHHWSESRENPPSTRDYPTLVRISSSGRGSARLPWRWQLNRRSRHTIFQMCTLRKPVGGKNEIKRKDRVWRILTYALFTPKSAYWCRYRWLTQYPVNLLCHMEHLEVSF